MLDNDLKLCRVLLETAINDLRKEYE